MPTTQSPRHIQDAAVLDALKDKPCGRPKKWAFLDRPSAVGVRLLVGRDERMGSAGVRTKG